MVQNKCALTKPIRIHTSKVPKSNISHPLFHANSNERSSYQFHYGALKNTLNIDKPRELPKKLKCIVKKLNSALPHYLSERNFGKRQRSSIQLQQSNLKESYFSTKDSFQISQNSDEIYIQAADSPKAYIKIEKILNVERTQVILFEVLPMRSDVLLLFCSFDSTLQFKYEREAIFQQPKILRWIYRLQKKAVRHYESQNGDHPQEIFVFINFQFDGIVNEILSCLRSLSLSLNEVKITITTVNNGQNPEQRFCNILFTNQNVSKEYVFEMFLRAIKAGKKIQRQTEKKIMRHKFFISKQLVYDKVDDLAYELALDHPGY